MASGAMGCSPRHWPSCNLTSVLWAGGELAVDNSGLIILESGSQMGIAFADLDLPGLADDATLNPVCCCCRHDGTHCNVVGMPIQEGGGGR